FAPMAVARTSKRLGLRSEASARFERGVDIGGVHRAVARFAEVLAETAPALCARGATVDVLVAGAADRAQLRVRVARVNAVLGTSLSAEDVTRYLTPLGFGTALGDGAVDVVVPTFRPDVTAEIDVVEEVARHHGYANIARTTVRAPASTRARWSPSTRWRARSRCCAPRCAPACCAPPRSTTTAATATSACS